MPDCNWRRIMDLPSTTLSSAQLFSRQFIQLTTIHVLVFSLTLHIDFYLIRKPGHRDAVWIELHLRCWRRYTLCGFHSRFHCDARHRCRSVSFFFSSEDISRLHIEILLKKNMHSLFDAARFPAPELYQINNNLVFDPYILWCVAVHDTYSFSSYSLPKSLPHSLLACCVVSIDKWIIYSMVIKCLRESNETPWFPNKKRQMPCTRFM